MRNFCKSVFLIITAICVSAYCFTGSNQIKVRFIANCGLHISDGSTDIYIDFPYKSGAYNMYSEYDKSEVDSIRDNAVLIFTHKHWDHYSGKLVKKYRSDGRVYGPWNVKRLEQLDSSIRDFSIQAFKSKHRYSFNHCSYLLTWHGKKIFISGDTENADTIARMSGLDWAFIPVWLLMDARKKGLKIDTKMIGLYHIGPKDRITTSDPKIHLMDKKGEVISIPF